MVKTCHPFCLTDWAVGWLAHWSITTNSCIFKCQLCNSLTASENNSCQTYPWIFIVHLYRLHYASFYTHSTSRYMHTHTSYCNLVIFWQITYITHRLCVIWDVTINLRLASFGFTEVKQGESDQMTPPHIGTQRGLLCFPLRFHSACFYVASYTLISI